MWTQETSKTFIRNSDQGQAVITRRTLTSDKLLPKYFKMWVRELKKKMQFYREQIIFLQLKDKKK